MLRDPLSEAVSGGGGGGVRFILLEGRARPRDINRSRRPMQPSGTSLQVVDECMFDDCPSSNLLLLCI